MYKLANNTIHGSDKNLFISNGDHNLIEIVGDSVSHVENVIAGFKTNRTIDGLYEEIKGDFENDRNYFDEICNWLIGNKIIEKIENQREEDYQIATHIWNISEKDQIANVIKKLSETSDSTNCIFNEEQDLNKAELILVFAPIFENLNDLLNINEYAYNKGIPICHIGFDGSNVFTLGPIVYSELRTACLNCYSTRKLANLKKPQKTLSFTQHLNKNVIVKSDFTKSKYYEIAIIHLKMELIKFFTSKKRMSSILGNSLVFDNNNYSITKTSILKVPNCPICNPLEIYSPFNI